MATTKFKARIREEFYREHSKTHTILEMSEILKIRPTTVWCALQKLGLKVYEKPYEPKPAERKRKLSLLERGVLLEFEATAMAYGIKNYKSPSRKIDRRQNAPLTKIEFSTIEKVNNIVATHFSVEPEMLRSKSRDTKTFIIRGISIWICYHVVGLRHWAMSDYYNSGWHHKSLYAVQQIGNMMDLHFPCPTTGIHVKNEVAHLIKIVTEQVLNSKP